MVFSSIIFLLYFLPILILAYLLTPQKFKNALLLIASIFFYWWGAPIFIYVILGTTAIDFLLVQQMAKCSELKKRKLLLIASLSINLSLLFYFKYCNFLIENINAVLQSVGLTSIYWTKLVLPIGISFYTFESITYVVDVYRKVHTPLKNFWEYQLYILFFPKLIAGPIIRFHDIADQMNGRFENDTFDQKLTGFYRFALGLGKKILIANQLGLFADEIFNHSLVNINSYSAWMAILAYTFQLYFDFSGYSDMAIGLAKIFGFRFPENFHNPYTSKSITEFWRRWHISLGSWMKNYLYIPLGGNKVNSSYRLYLNLGIVFIASGFWHGASWNFILWGAYHGLFLILERAFLLKFYDKLGTLFPMLFSFLIVLCGWVFFRLENFDDAILFFKKLFSFQGGNNDYFNFKFFFFLTIACFFAFFTSLKWGEKIQNKIYFETYTNARHITLTLVSLLLFILSVSIIAGTNFNPFIYFRF